MREHNPELDRKRTNRTAAKDARSSGAASPNMTMAGKQTRIGAFAHGDASRRSIPAAECQAMRRPVADAPAVARASRRPLPVSDVSFPSVFYTYRPEHVYKTAVSYARSPASACRAPAASRRRLPGPDTNQNSRTAAPTACGAGEE